MKFKNRDGAEDGGEVWSPGPYANSVWLVDGRCVKKTKAGWVERVGRFETAADFGRYLNCGDLLGRYKASDRQAEYLKKGRNAPKLENEVWAEATR